MLQIENQLYHTFITAIAVISLLFIVFAISIFHHFRQRKIQLDAKTFQDECALEADRKRIASDLHDDFGSELTGLKLHLNELLNDHPDILLLHSSTEMIDRSLNRLREISLNLLPRELAQEGLSAAIESLVDRINESSNIKVFYKATFLDRNFNIEKSMMLFRIIQEITTNAIKHSGADFMEIGIARKEKWLIVEVRDDGKGFYYDEAYKQKKSSGLKNIQSRLDLLHAILVVHTEPNKGTHYFIKIPIRRLTNEISN